MSDPEGLDPADVVPTDNSAGEPVDLERVDEERPDRAGSAEGTGSAGPAGHDG